MVWLLTGLFALLPLYLLRFQLGPLPTTALEILVWLVVGVWIFEKIKTRQFNFNVPNQKLFLISTALFLLGATIGVLVSPNLRAALGEWKAFYVEPVLIGLIILDTVKTKAEANKILLGLLLGALLTALLGTYQHFTGWLVPYSFWANRNTYRVTSVYGFPNGVGLLLAPLLPISIYLTREYWAKVTRQKSALALSAIILFIVFAPLAIVFAKTTAALVGLAAGLGVLLLCFKRARLPTVILGLISFISLFFLPPNPITNELLARDFSGQLRRDIWTETITYLKMHPVVGTGVAGYATEIASLRHNKNIEVFHHPHNIFLTLWVNIGLIGLIGFIGLLVWFGKTIWPLTGSNRAFKITLLVTMTVWLTMGLVDSPYIKNDWALIFWLYLCLAKLAPEK